jgi:hypothetical protein
VTFSAAFVLGVAFALLPIYSQLPRLVTWIFNLGIHSGQYNSGAVGLPETSVYLSSLSYLLEAEPLIAIIPIVATIVVLVLSVSSKKQKPANAVSWRTALALLAIQAVSFLAIAKETGTHYLIPLSLSTGISLVFLFRAFHGALGFKQAIGCVALIGLLALGFKDFIVRTPAACAALHDEKVDQLRLYRHAKEITKNDVRVDYFFSDSPEFALCYGNDFAGRAFGSLLARMYPNALFLNVFTGKFETFTTYIEPGLELQKYDHLYFLGEPDDFPKIDGFDPKTFETIDHAGEYYLQKWTRELSP